MDADVLADSEALVEALMEADVLADSDEMCIRDRSTSF